MTYAYYFEVGANNGNMTEALSQKENAFVFAFEPSPLLYPDLMAKFAGRQNIIILPFAVGISNTIADFNVSDRGDKGFGSLYEYHPNLQETALKKHGVFREPFIYKQKVPVIRLDTFMEMLSISRIEYIHIDAQGNDFNVIKSLGEKIAGLEAGRCECSYKIQIYDTNNQNDYAECEQYLKNNGFEVKHDHIHEDESEIDLRFYRKI